MFKTTKKIDIGAPQYQTFSLVLKQGVNDVERLLFFYLLKIIHEKVRRTIFLLTNRVDPDLTRVARSGSVLFAKSVKRRRFKVKD